MTSSLLQLVSHSVTDMIAIAVMHPVPLGGAVQPATVRGSSSLFSAPHTASCHFSCPDDALETWPVPGA
jgi:hypothetical protein